MPDSPSVLADALRDRYRFERELGAGGMARVWLADDLKHERKVAIKVLHPELAAVLGTERFLAEIKVTANLQHPHILPLFDSGQASGQLFYVMPYVEGESLRARLAREKQLPIDEAIRITQEIASALDYAHRRGVIHRDIKPENVLLQDGTALVADFGIALAVSKAGGTRLTQTGLSLGTPQYMSPEQATGDHAVDARSDVYSLAATLYEMLTGDPPFTGSTAQAVVAKLLTERPAEIRRFRSTVPEQVEEAVFVALAKLPADRFASVAEFARALEGGIPAGRRTPGRPTVVSALARRPRSRWARTSLLAGVLGLVGLAAWGWLRPQPEGAVTRSWVTLESFDVTQPGGSEVPAISPDGSRIVYADLNGHLLLLDQDQIHPKPVPSAGTAAAAFFSPDGKTVGVLTAFPGALKLVPLDGGAPRTLVADSVSGWGGSWGNDGWIYFVAGQGGTLRRIRPSGGTSELVAQADSTRDELLFRWPEILPGGRAALVTIERRKSPPDIGVIDTRSHDVRVLTQGVVAFYAPSGHLVYVRGNGELMAVPFDAKRLSLTGRPVRMEDGIALEWGTATIALSPNGALLYARYSPKSEVVRVSRDGRAQSVDSAWTGEFVAPPALSPSGDRLAVSTLNGASLELWVKELDHGVFTRLASGGTLNYRPAWSPDGLSLLFPSDRSGIWEQLFSVPADGSSPPRLLRHLPGSVDEGLWSHDGRWLIYRTGSGSARDIYGMRPGVDSAPGLPLAATEAEEYAPALSPDGQWLAYVSDESGRAEVYVRPFPQVGTAREQVSREGGTEPVWGNADRELFYRSGTGKLIAVRFAPGAPFRVTAQQSLFDASGYVGEGYHVGYSVAPDDRTFYFIRPLPGPPPQIVLVRSWFRELKAQVTP